MICFGNSFAFEDEAGDYVPEGYIFVQDENYIGLEDVALMDDKKLSELELTPLDPFSGLADSSGRTGQYRLNSSYSVNVPYIPQMTGYYCGPAATLQAIYASGQENMVPGTTVNEKQQQIAIAELTGTGGTFVQNIVGVLNVLIPRTRQWTMAKLANNNSDMSHLQYFARSNHAYNYATIYLVTPGRLDYRLENPVTLIGHYVTGQAIFYNTLSASDYDNIVISIVDPSNSSVGGTHHVWLKDLIDAMEHHSLYVNNCHNFVY